MSQAANLIIGRLGSTGAEADRPARKPDRGRSSYGISRLGICPAAEEQTPPAEAETEPSPADLAPLMDEAPKPPVAAPPETPIRFAEPVATASEAVAAEATMPPLSQDAWANCRKCTFKLPYELAGRLKHYAKVAGKYQYLVATDAIRRYLAELGPALTYPPDPPATRAADNPGDASPPSEPDTQLPAVQNELPKWMQRLVGGPPD